MAFVNISGATASSYTLVTADLGAQMRCVVIAANSAGSASANAAQVGPVTAPPDPPLNTSAPAISGSAVVGQVITAADGTWTGTPTISYARQWKRGSTNIGSGLSTYTLVTADIGFNITCVVTATNGAGSVSATSNSIGPVTATVSPSGWSRVPLGPGGFISGIEVHADGTKVIRMDTSGAYKWTAATSRWDMMLTTSTMPSTLTDPGYATNPGVYEIGVSKSNSSRIYFAWQHKATYQVMRSNDGGATFAATNFWAQTPTATFDSNSPKRGAGKKMAIDPVNPDVVFFGSTAGVHYTLDGGANWTTVAAAQIPASGDGVYLLAVDPSSTTTGGRKPVIYATSGGNGLYKTSNGGTTWAVVTGGPSTTAYWDLKIASNGTVWLTKEVAAYNMDIHKLVGTTWSTLTTGIGSDGGYLLYGVAIDPTDDNHVVTVTEMGSLSSTFNGGTSWTGYGLRHTDWAPITWLNSIYGGDGNYGLSPGATMAFDPSVSNTLLLGTGLGLVKGTAPPSTASGLAFTMQWSGYSVGLEQLCAKRINKPSGNSGVILSVMDQGIFKCDGTSYPTYKGVMPYFSAAWDCDSCPGDPATIITIVNENASFGGPEDQSGISRDGGGTWNPFYGSANGAPYHDYGLTRVGGMIACGATRDNFMIITMSCNPFYTADGGAHWSQCSFPADFPTTGDDRGWSTNSYDQRHVICGDRVTANVFYARNGWSQHFYKSTDGGANFSVLPDPATSIGTGPHSRLEAVPGNAGHLFYTMGSSGLVNGGGSSYGPFQRSINGGTTWTPLASSSTSGVWEVIGLGFGKNAPGQSYPAIYIIGWVNNVYGVWRSDDNATTWASIGDFPMGCFDTPVDITGDPDVYGTCYTSIGASGIFKYAP